MNGEKIQAVETQGAAPALAVTEAYQGEADFLGATQGMSEQAPGLLRSEVAAAWAACGAFERAAFAYFGVSSVLIALFAEHLPHPLRLLGLRHRNLPPPSNQGRRRDPQRSCLFLRLQTRQSRNFSPTVD